MKCLIAIYDVFNLKQTWLGKTHEMQQNDELFYQWIAQNLTNIYILPIGPTTFHRFYTLPDNLLNKDDRDYLNSEIMRSVKPPPLENHRYCEIQIYNSDLFLYYH